MLAAGEEKLARGLLEKHQLAGEGAELARRWLRALSGPRVGPVALEPGRAPGGRRRARDPVRNDPSLLENRWHTGLFVATQQRVRVRFGTPGDRPAYREQLELWSSALVPGVVHPLLADADAEQPYVAVLLMGHRLRQPSGKSPDGLRTCIELCEMLGALAHQRIALPDAEVQRFSVDHTGRPWLVDLFGSERVDSEAALKRHAHFAASLVTLLLGIEPSVVGDKCSDLRELVRWLERRWLGLPAGSAAEVDSQHGAQK